MKYLITIILISLSFFSYAENIVEIIFFNDPLIRNSSSDSTKVVIAEKQKNNSGTIFSIQYGHGNKNLYADEFEEIKFSMQHKFDYGSVGLFWRYLNNKHDGSECTDILDEFYRFEYDIGNIGVMFELNEKYYGAGLSLSYLMIGERGCNLSGSEEVVLPKIWLNIGSINKYYFTIGFVDHFPMTIEEAYFSFGATYTFDDSFSKITLRKIGIKKSAGIALESEIRIIDLFLLNGGLHYYFELKSHEKEIQKDLYYFNIGIGYIL